jgi:hypothetical protein
MINACKAFLRAASLGALAGSAPYLMLTVSITVDALDDLPPNELPLALFFAISPLLYAALGTAAGLTLVGLPLTAYLHHCREEQVGTYLAAGIGAGFLLPLLFAATITGFTFDVALWALLLGVPGTLAGAVTSAVWGKWRMQAANPINDVRPNRYHDERILR